MIFGIFFFAIFLLAIWRRFHVHNSHVKFRHTLYALRDELRMKAIQGEIDSDFWLFNYYDKTISKQISNTYYITIFFIVSSAELHRNDEKLKNFRVELNNTLKKQPFYSDLDIRLKAATLELIKEQHYVSINFILTPILMPILGGITMYKAAKHELSQISSLPELSNAPTLLST